MHRDAMYMGARELRHPFEYCEFITSIYIQISKILADLNKILTMIKILILKKNRNFIDKKNIS